MLALSKFTDGKSGKLADNKAEKTLAPILEDVEDALYKPVDQDIEDVLYEQGASLEFVEELARREERSLSGDGHGEPLGSHLRGAALATLAWLAQAVQLPSSGFFSVVALVDDYSKRVNGGLTAERLPGVCAAAVHLEKKMQESHPRFQASQLAAYTTQLSVWLRQFGHDTPEKVSVQQLEEEQRRLLGAMEWQIGAPTLESWLTLLVQRFNVFTQGKYVQQLGQVTQRSLLCARALVSHVPSSPDVPPRTVAQGLLGLALASEGILPIETLAKGASQSRDCHPGAQRREQDAQVALCAAAHASWAEMRASCELAAAAVQEAALASKATADAAAQSAPLPPSVGGA